MPLRILLDLNILGLKKSAARLRNVEVLCVTDLQAQGLRMKSDYSMICYAVRNNRMIVTKDVDVFIGCDENDIPCILANRETKWTSRISNDGMDITIAALVTLVREYIAREQPRPDKKQVVKEKSEPIRVPGAMPNVSNQRHLEKMMKQIRNKYGFVKI